MTTITPQRARRCINRAEIYTSLAEVHTAWGWAVWNAGDYRGAVRNWLTAARLYGKAKREDGAR